MPRAGKVADARVNGADIDETCLVVTNKSAAKGAEIDMGGVEFEPDEGEEGAVEYEV